MQWKEIPAKTSKELISDKIIILCHIEILEEGEAVPHINIIKEGHCKVFKTTSNAFSDIKVLCELKLSLAHVACTRFVLVT